MIKKFFYIIVTLTVLGSLAAGIGSRYVDRNFNQVLDLPLPTITPETKALHDSLLIMDWHNDALLWNRDFVEGANRGHSDLPRLQQGNTGLQMFTIVSKSPRGLNINQNEDSSDNITALAMIQGWPVRTWNSLIERGLYQAAKLDAEVAASGGQLRWIKSRADLNHFLQQRDKTEPKPIGVLLGSEGSHVLEGDLANLDKLYNAGLRMMGLQHFFDNRAGGSQSGVSKGGLTAFGRELVVALNEKKIIIDLAHSSTSVVEDVLAITARPVVVSHIGVKGVCDSERNLPDSLLKAIADQGGLIAIGYWREVICDVSPKGIARAIQYAVDLVGEDHVALGSDFDGTVITPFDAAGIAQITQALLAAGLTETQIRKVMGENSVRFLLSQLPADEA